MAVNLADKVPVTRDQVHALIGEVDGIFKNLLTIDLIDQKLTELEGIREKLVGQEQKFYTRVGVNTIADLNKRVMESWDPLRKLNQVKPDMIAAMTQMNASKGVNAQVLTSNAVLSMMQTAVMGYIDKTVLNNAANLQKAVESWIESSGITFDPKGSGELNVNLNKTIFVSHLMSYAHFDENGLFQEFKKVNNNSLLKGKNQKTAILNAVNKAGLTSEETSSGMTYTFTIAGEERDAEDFTFEGLYLGFGKEGKYKPEEVKNSLYDFLSRYLSDSNNSSGTLSDLVCLRAAIDRMPINSLYKKSSDAANAMIGLVGELGMDIVVMKLFNTTNPSAIQTGGIYNKLELGRKGEVAIDYMFQDTVDGILNTYGFQSKAYTPTVGTRDGAIKYKLKNNNAAAPTVFDELGLNEEYKDPFCAIYAMYSFNDKDDGTFTQDRRLIEQLERRLRAIYSLAPSSFMRIYQEIETDTIQKDIYYNTFFWFSNQILVPSSCILQGFINAIKEWRGFQTMRLAVDFSRGDMGIANATITKYEPNSRYYNKYSEYHKKKSSKAVPNLGTVAKGTKIEIYSSIDIAKYIGENVEQELRDYLRIYEA